MLECIEYPRTKGKQLSTDSLLPSSSVYAKVNAVSLEPFTEVLVVALLFRLEEKD
jgi:hypothetical protein